jgi:hypothetical protein
MYGILSSFEMTRIFALGSFDFIALNAAKLAVPPPMRI